MRTGYRGGWTLPEVLCVIAIVSALAAIAQPHWRDAIGRLRTQSAVNEFTGGLAQARSEAIRRASTVFIQRHDNCAQRDWSCGWFSYEDANGNLQFDEGTDPVIRAFDPPSSVLVSTNAAALRQRLRLTSSGSSHGVQAGSFFFRHGEGSCMRLVLSAGLRWRTEAC